MQGQGRRLDISLSDEAIDWLVRLNSGHATIDDRSAFDRWRARSGDHELAAQEAEALWQGLGAAGRQVQSTAASGSKLTRRTILGVSAVLAGGLAIREFGYGTRAFADHVTGVGERRTVKLPDGSVLSLNATTAVAVDFRPDERRLHLLDGEASFEVMHDRARPFVVDAGSGRTRSLGAAFNIDMRPDETVVAVMEGVVEISTSHSGGSAMRAQANQLVRYSAQRAPALDDTVDVAAETAWRRGKLIFNRRSLSDVVAEIKRYRPGSILIASSRLRSLEVTGVFDLRDPEAILATIEETLPVSATRLPYLTILR